MHLNMVPLRNHLKTLLLVIILGALIQTIKIGFTTLPLVLSNSITVGNTLQAHFPDDLAISWSNNTLVFNRDILQVPIPDLLSKKNPFDGAKTVYISSSELNIDQATQLLEKNSIVSDQKVMYFKNDTQIAPLALSELIVTDQFTITKGSLDSWLLILKQQTNQLQFAVSIIIFLVLTISLVCIRSITLLFDSVLVYIFSKLNATKYTFTYIILVCLNAMIPSEIIYQIGSIYNSTLPLYGLVFWFYLVIVFTYHFVHSQKLKGEEKKAN